MSGSPSFSAKIYGEIIAQVQTANGTTQNVSCSADPAPNYRDLFVNHNPQFLVAWIIGGACALVALIICFHHLWLFSRMEKSNLRSSYIGVVLMAPVFAITNYLALFFPRAALLFELIQHMYEAQALASFGRLMFDLATDGETDELVAKQIMIARMARRNPQSLPPL